MKRLSVLLTVLLFSYTVYAGGYRVALQGARMLGMAHAGTAMFNNSEAMFFNPSGVAFLDGQFNFTFGISLVKSNVKYQNEQYLWQAQTENPLGTPFYLYLSYKENEHFYFGMAVYTPYGSTVKWQDGWVGSHLVNKISLKAIYFQPTMVYKMNDYFSISAAFIAATGSVQFNKDVNRFLTDDAGNRTDITLNAEGISGSGYALGFTIRAADRISFGVNYRSKIVFKARYGTAELNDAPVFFPRKDAFEAELPMPAELSVGLALKPFKNLSLAFDVNRTYWSAYKSLNIDFKSKLPDNKMPKNWRDVNTFRIGAEFAFNDNLAVRAGYYYDQSPIPAGYFSPDTPSLDSDNYTFGFTYSHKKFAFDFAFLYVDGKERTDSYNFYKEGLGAPRFEGTYVTNAFVPSFGFNLKL